MTDRTKGIDLTPTWEALIPVLVEVAARGTTPEAQQEAMGELLRLARIVDKMNEEAKGQ